MRLSGRVEVVTTAPGASRMAGITMCRPLPERGWPDEQNRVLHARPYLFAVAGAKQVADISGCCVGQGRSQRFGSPEQSLTGGGLGHVVPGRGSGEAARVGLDLREWRRIRTNTHPPKMTRAASRRAVTIQYMTGLRPSASSAAAGSAGLNSTPRPEAGPVTQLKFRLSSG